MTRLESASKYCGCPVCIELAKGKKCAGTHSSDADGAQRPLPFPTWLNESGRLDLKTRSYSCDDLVAGFIQLWENLALDHTDLMDPDGIQQQALDRMRDEFRKGSELAMLNNKKSLQFFFRQLDDYLFFGVLSQWTRVDMVDEMSNPTSLGSMSVNKKKPAPHVSIKVLRRMDLGYGHAEASLAILNCLLHEMAHAVLDIFSCRCSCVAGTKGVTGHGPSWMMLGQAIEREMNRYYANRDDQGPFDFPWFERWTLAAGTENAGYRAEIKRLGELGMEDQLAVMLNLAK